MTPLVSILLPVFNGARYLRETIDSILTQTHKNFELIIVDDCSTDTTREIVKSYADERIKYYHNEQNRKIVYTLNRALSLARGKYCARIDADDIMLPSRLEEQVAFLEGNLGYSLVDSVQDCINERGEKIGRYNSYIIDESEIVETMPKTNCLGHPSIMVRSDILNEYQYRSIVYEDYDLWLRMLNDGKKIFKLGHPLTLFRVHDLSLTGTAQVNNKHFLNIAKTKLFYFKNLSFSEKLKAFNLKVAMWMLLDYATAYYKKIKRIFKR